MHSLSGLVTGLDVQFNLKPVHRKHSTLSSACLQASYSSSLIQSLSRETCDMSASPCTIPQGACAQVVECFCMLCVPPSPRMCLLQRSDVLRVSLFSDTKSSQHAAGHRAWPSRVSVLCTPSLPRPELFIRLGEVTHIYYSFCIPGVKLPVQQHRCET